MIVISRQTLFDYKYWYEGYLVYRNKNICIIPNEKDCKALYDALKDETNIIALVEDNKTVSNLRFIDGKWTEVDA